MSASATQGGHNLRIRGCTTMRYINLCFTYLLTYFEPASNQLHTSSEPASVMELGFYAA